MLFSYFGKPQHRDLLSSCMSGNTKLVREANRSGGPCNLLGLLIKETATKYAYRTRICPEAYIPKRLAHIEPCPMCPDHPGSRFRDLAARV
jgi:hypothetical protein